ncbi:MAG: hypothetical protein E6R03_18310 [Hyphomicrobiaceae bacterium]|nr:MAG: hypothetical protein E6R03_18310 [Hyphomicrobiaceae bacterium]
MDDNKTKKAKLREVPEWPEVPRTGGVRKLRKAAFKKTVETFGDKFYVVEVTRVSKLDVISNGYVFETLELKVKLGKNVIGYHGTDSQPVSEEDWIQLQVESILSRLAGQVENAIYTY